MKTAAKCVSACESQDYQMHRPVERTLRRRYYQVLTPLPDECLYTQASIRLRLRSRAAYWGARAGPRPTGPQAGAFPQVTDTSAARPSLKQTICPDRNVFCQREKPIYMLRPLGTPPNPAANSIARDTDLEHGIALTEAAAAVGLSSAHPKPRGGCPALCLFRRSVCGRLRPV